MFILRLKMNWFGNFQLLIHFKTKVRKFEGVLKVSKPDIQLARIETKINRIETK